LSEMDVTGRCARGDGHYGGNAREAGCFGGRHRVLVTTGRARGDGHYEGSVRGVDKCVGRVGA